MHARRLRQRRHRRRQVPHAQPDPLERPALPAPLGVEQRELPELGVHAHQRERVRLLDRVHPEVLGEESGQLLAPVDPEGHVVKARRVYRLCHLAAITRRSVAKSRRRLEAPDLVAVQLDRLRGHVLLQVLD